MKARDNPFSVEYMHSLPYHFVDGEFEIAYARWEQLQRRGAIVGPHGSGKSTLLKRWREELEKRALKFVDIALNDKKNFVSQAENHQLKSADPETIAIVDGAEQLNWFRWRRLLASIPRQSGLLVTIHEPGRLPTVWTCHTSVELLEHLVKSLLADQPAADQWLSTLGPLFEQHDGNLRDCIRSLYDQWAKV